MNATNPIPNPIPNLIPNPIPNLIPNPIPNLIPNPIPNLNVSHRDSNVPRSDTSINIEILKEVSAIRELIGRMKEPLKDAINAVDNIINLTRHLIPPANNSLPSIHSMLDNVPRSLPTSSPELGRAKIPSRKRQRELPRNDEPKPDETARKRRAIEPVISDEENEEVEVVEVHEEDQVRTGIEKEQEATAKPAFDLTNIIFLTALNKLVPFEIRNIQCSDDGRISCLTPSHLVNYNSLYDTGAVVTYQDGREKVITTDMIYHKNHIILAYSYPLALRVYPIPIDAPVKSLTSIMSAPTKLCGFENRILFGQHNGDLYLNEDINSFDRETSWKKSLGHKMPITALAMNDEYIYSGGSDHIIQEIKGFSIGRKFYNIKLTVTSLTLNKTHLCAVNKKGEVYIFKIGNNKPCYITSLDAPVIGCISDSTGFYLATDSKLTFISNDGGGFIDAEGQRAVVKFPEKVSAFSRMGDKLLFGTTQGHVFVWTNGPEKTNS